MCSTTTATFGAFSLGLTIAVLPAAIAPMRGGNRMFRGKLYALVHCQTKTPEQRRVLSWSYPMISTRPNGSLRILGLNSACARAMSGALSSFAHLSRLLHTKMQSLVHQSSSIRPASKAPLFRSFLQAAKRALELSFNLE